jgi:hypothetical protein
MRQPIGAMLIAVAFVIGAPSIIHAIIRYGPMLSEDARIGIMFGGAVACAAAGFWLIRAR